MKEEAYTIRIFVPTGDPEGINIIDKFHWTGKIATIPRDQWKDEKGRSFLQFTGVYLLVGPPLDDNETPNIYIGQADNLKKRIDQHYSQKDFWNRVILLTTSDNTLNRAHVTWLEYSLYQKAKKVGRYSLKNSTSPSMPSLSEMDVADMKAYLAELLPILPLLEIKAFEKPKVLRRPKRPFNKPSLDERLANNEIDTIIVPANKDGFKKVFIGDSCWWAVRIAAGKIEKLDYIAAYQTQPISAITHIAPIDRIEPYGEEGKYKIVFSEPAKEIDHVPFGRAKRGTMQGIRYSNLKKISSADQLKEVF